MQARTVPASEVKDNLALDIKSYFNQAEGENPSTLGSMLAKPKAVLIPPLSTQDKTLRGLYDYVVRNRTDAAFIRKLAKSIDAFAAERAIDAEIEQLTASSKDVVLTCHSNINKIQCIKYIREYTGLGLREAKDIADAAHAYGKTTIGGTWDAEDFQRFQQGLVNSGCGYTASRP